MRHAKAGYDSGKITAIDLVNAAIEAEKLSSATAIDEQYINDVDYLTRTVT